MRQRGFSLLEAIIALTLLSVAGLSLLSWIHANLAGLRRIEQAAQRDAAIRNALNFVAALNPALKPQGRQNVAGYAFAWQSRPLEPLKDGVNYLGATSFYQVGLYEVQIQVFQADLPLAEITARQPGYQQARQPAWRQDTF
jgi:general secretion pathway protein I